MFLLSVFAYMSLTPVYDDASLRVFGSMVEQALVATVNLRLLIETQNLTLFSLAVYTLGWLFFVVVGLIRSSHPTLSSFFALVAFDYLAVHNQLLLSLTAWLVQVCPQPNLHPKTCTLPRRLDCRLSSAPHS